MDREEKYDRQLRLWENQGQQLLESARVLVVQPTVTSLELVKNLVLPGVGSFTLLDEPQTVQSEDLVSFYLSPDDVGSERMSSLVKNLNELNEDVAGDFHHVEDVNVWLQTVQPTDFWNQYDLVVLNWEYPLVLEQLSKLKIPVIVTNTLGFYGILRIFKPSVEVVETHTQGVADLRIVNPWDELLQYSDSIDLESLDVEEHAQIPYLIIQLKAVQAWRKAHTQLPKTSQEKKGFKKMIMDWKKDYQELNFDEAVENSHMIMSSTGVPHSIQELLQQVDTRLEEENSRSLFWILVKALKAFVTRTGVLPLTGALPDMTSSTGNYLALKKIYQGKADADRALFTQKLDKILETMHWNHAVDPQTVQTFLKNSRHLYFSQSSCQPLNYVNTKIATEHEDSKSNLVLIGIFLVQQYILAHNALPTLDHLDDLFSQRKSLTASHELYDVLREILRAQGQQLNNICSVMGGIAGQEAIKLVTNQYIPVDNTLIFDGLRSVTERWKV
ncbi:Ula1p CYBJADRAFT_166404 [Cyberlindnera jadinii NRRL Y-1542]|uniref:NEDD8-activating enzyme E1 regulatory subunit n=1 Tax=Cyberlindnera jadinii (strain ATCC 18201 / CBS 1600 / BCRC 20928 / JCM 3617 / NBRC 0987 / NRRL Y-1542) TaxID=983966 RepID=A0A1E4S541_CYBJN|nr:hypothetical protein CYBJADRAFT_166404 [Cyberlindnera jadinii NRRL Y-1542]ODV74605.1 hypothetical protein CYBJADRAFT_166404 [Cyberlindnera jadinii NRRL Y-1542]